ncbi:uncharacterized protein AAES06_013210 isoform 1-T1 [Glossophaga mutica]
MSQCRHRRDSIRLALAICLAWMSPGFSQMPALCSAPAPQFGSPDLRAREHVDEAGPRALGCVPGFVWLQFGTLKFLQAWRSDRERLWGTWERSDLPPGGPERPRRPVLVIPPGRPEKG